MAKASNIKADHANVSNWGNSAGASINHEDIIRAIKKLQTDLKGDDKCLRQEFNVLRQEIKDKLDNLVTEIQGLSDWVEEPESCVEKVEDWVAEVKMVLCSCLEQQRNLREQL